MATELIRRVLCDRCLTDDDQKVDATVSERVSLGQQIVEIDLCARCAADVLAPARELLRLGRAPSSREIAEPPRSRQTTGNGDTASEFGCPLCTVVVKTRQTFRKHLSDAHGMDFGEYLKSVGKEAFPCSEKGCAFVSVDATGLGMHRQRMHHRRQ